MIVMSIAGVDPSGGAGIFADLKTFQAIGVYGTGIVTALTSQNPYEFFSTQPVSPIFFIANPLKVAIFYTSLRIHNI